MNHLPKDVTRCAASQCPKASECARFMDVPFGTHLTWVADLCDWQESVKTCVYPSFIPTKMLSGATRIDL
jgi:hypothetical protein